MKLLYLKNNALIVDYKDLTISKSVL